jgi:hypothetical protein
VLLCALIDSDFKELALVSQSIHTPGQPSALPQFL